MKTLNRLKRIYTSHRLTLILGTCLIATAAAAQNYSIDWFTIDGGGGTSTSAVYSVSGTVGQPDAGTLSGGAYTLVGGFWSVVAAVQTPGAPFLTITRDPVTGAVTVSWDAPATGFVLEQTATLVGSPTIPWSQASGPYQTNAGKIFITIPSPPGNRFYRLRNP